MDKNLLREATSITTTSGQNTMQTSSNILETTDGAQEAMPKDTLKPSTTQSTVRLALLYPWKAFASCIQEVAPTPPAAFFFVIVGIYYISLSGYRKDFINRGIAPDDEAQLKKARYDFLFIIAAGVSFVFSALYFGADMFSSLWALMGPSAALAVHQGQYGVAGDNGVLSRRGKEAVINAALALVGASMVVYAAWLQYLRQIAELQEGGAYRGSAGYGFWVGY